MKKPERLEQKAWIDMRTLIDYCTIKGYRLCLKLFKQSLLAGTTTTHWQGTLVSIKSESSLVGNIIGRASERMLRPMSKAATSIWL